MEDSWVGPVMLHSHVHSIRLDTPVVAEFGSGFCLARVPGLSPI